jgi:hypothetical protein
MPFNTKDMNISLSAFGSAPIRREGEAVKYDFNEDGTFMPLTNHEINIDFDESDNEVINK